MRLSPGTLRDPIQYPIGAAAAAKSGAHATNLLFEKVDSWQDIDLENYVLYGPEDAEATKHPKNGVVSLWKRQNQHCF